MEVYEHFNRACAYVDLDAITENMRHMYENLPAETMLAAVVKTDGYGHGSVALAKELESEAYLWGFCTASKEEAQQLRMAGIRKPILILSFTFPDAAEYIVDHEIRATVFTLEMARELSNAALSLHKTAKVHLKIDTGMGRIGIRTDEEGLQLAEQIYHLPALEIEGIFTHFARADEADKTAAQKQYDVFNCYMSALEKRLSYKIPIHHCANSAATLELPSYHMDMTRAGITMYGLWPSAEVNRSIVALKPAMKIVSHVAFVKDVYPGESISYGGTFVASGKMRVATIPIGYGDGYPRGLSNKGEVLIRGQRCKIVGRVCMDQFMVDVTHVPDATVYDEVTIVGRDHDEELSMEELGEVSGRFNYELVCDLGKRIPRVYLKGGQVIAYKDYTDDVPTVYL